MKSTAKLKNLLISEIIPDLEEVIDEIFSKIEKSKMVSIADKEELQELQDMYSECKAMVSEINSGEMDEDEAEELLNELVDLKTLE